MIPISFSHFTTCWIRGALLALSVLALGCNAEPPTQAPNAIAQLSPAKQENSPREQPASAKRVALGKDVWFETEGNQRRVLVETMVCLREGGLECLLCRARTKEHEAILSTAADAQVIHAGLLAAGAKPGSPVQYVEKNGEVVVVPPTGSRIKISVRYEAHGKRVTLPAQQWIRNAKTKKPME